MRNIWIFQLFEPLSSDHTQKLDQELSGFLAAWHAHGTPVPARYETRYDRFVLIHAREDSASGCSIDRMYREVIGKLETAGAKLAGPENIFFRKQDGTLGYFNFQETEAMLRGKQLGPETIVFNAAISTEEELSGFEAPLKNTWMSRFLSVQTA